MDNHTRDDGREDRRDEDCEGVGPLGLSDWEMALWVEQLKKLSAGPKFGYAQLDEVGKIPLHGADAWWTGFVLGLSGSTGDPARN